MVVHFKLVNSSAAVGTQQLLAAAAATPLKVVMTTEYCIAESTGMDG